MFSIGAVSFGVFSFEFKIPITIQIGKRPAARAGGDQATPAPSLANNVRRPCETSSIPATIRITHMRVLDGPAVPVPRGLTLIDPHGQRITT